MPGIPLIIPGDIEVAGNVILRGDVLVGEVDLGAALASALTRMATLEQRVEQLEGTAAARADA